MSLYMPSEPSPPEIVALMGALVRAAHRHTAAIAHDLDVGVSEAIALHHLASGPLTAGALGDLLGFSSSNSVTALVDRLEHQQMVARHPNPADRRSILLAVTETGMNRAAERLHGYGRALEQTAEKLDGRERETIARFLAEAIAITEQDASSRGA
jgi:DNA-binding MarR family transcriptional regulator